MAAQSIPGKLKKEADEKKIKILWRRYIFDTSSKTRSIHISKAFFSKDK